MKTLGERFKWRREQLDLTQEEATKGINRLLKNERSKFTRVTISNIENGNQQSMKDKVLLAVVQVLKCSAEWLVNNNGPVELPEFYSNSSFKMVPALSWDQIIPFTKSQLQPSKDSACSPCPVKCSIKTYSLLVVGEEMQPRFEDGDIIYIDPELIEPHNGKFVIVRKNGELDTSFRQLQLIDNQWFLKALNPDYPPEIKFTKINDGYEIIGTVICHLKPV